MATGDNPCIPLFEDGERPTAAVSAVVGGGKFVKVSGDMQHSPILDVAAPLTGGNLMVVAQCVAGEKAIGVSTWDAAAIGDVVGVMGPTLIVPMVAGAAITFGQKVMSDAAGLPVPWTSAASEANNANGIALNSAGGGATVWVALR